MKRHLLAVVALAACEGGGQSPPDGGIPGDGSLCDGAFAQQVTGELLEWDSSDASFQGVFDARLSFSQDPRFFFETPPNGRLDFCLHLALPDPQVILDLDSVDDHFDGVMYLEREALQTPMPVSIRSFTKTRAQTFFLEQGITAGVDPTAAQVVVLATGDRIDLALDRTHDVVQAGNEDGNGGIAWAAGTAGRYVLFPNVDATSPTVTLTGDLQRTHVVPIAPGELTLIVFSFVFVGP